MSNDKTVQGQVALVTGASRGIGQAIAQELAARGMKVIGTATTEDGAAKISTALAQHANCKGAKRALPLPVSAPFHSSLMKPAADKLRERLAQVNFQPPRIPVINNIEVQAETDPDRIRAALYEQAFGPVRWVECVRAMQARGITTIVECGPGKVLAGLVKRIDPALTGVAMYDPATLAESKGILG